MYSAVFERSRDSVVSWVKPETIQLLRGAAPVLARQQQLTELASRCGQVDAIDDLAYFLSRPQIRKKTPYLAAFPSLAAADVSSAPLDAAVLLYEHQVGGHDLHIFATDDTTGRRTVVSPLADRARTALQVCRLLMLQGAQCVLVSFRHGDAAVDPALGDLLCTTGLPLRWATRERTIAGYLPFAATLDATLAMMGTRTRNHLRYYRKRAEQQLGAVFVPDVTISREDFLALNRISAYATTDEVAAWRYDSLRQMQHPFLYGLRDRDGRWLSLMGGRHTNGNMEMYWQINRDDMPSQSLSTALRACMIEHETRLGTQRLYVEGGTTHSMSHAFVAEKATDLIVLRRSALSRVIPMLVRRFLPPENMLLKVFEDKDLQWKTVRKS